MRSKTEWIVIHCAATRPSMDIGVDEIRRWHHDRGWRDIGYHFVIRRGGAIEVGRAIDDIGAHVVGQNAVSVGVCLVGGITDGGSPENNFTPAQWASLRSLMRALVKAYPGARVRGHRDFAAKACPSFDAVAWAVKEGFPV
jgi:N-acetylmuramoyl-L-alanine amidase